MVSRSKSRNTIFPEYLGARLQRSAQEAIGSLTMSFR